MYSNLETNLKSPGNKLEKKIAELGPWFHNLHLPDKTQTAPEHPLGDYPSFKWEQISSFIPENLSGKQVLDIGCNAGFYSFEFAKRGAKVTGLDTDQHYLNQANWAAGIFSLQDKVFFKNMQVYDIINETEVFNIVLFMGVFYHLRYPLLALDIVSEKFSDLLIFQTMTMPGDEIFSVPENIAITERELLLNPGWPKMAFIEKNLAGDNTNWWAPNSSAVEAMLRSAGLEIIHRPAHEIYICRKFKDSKRSQYLNDVFNSFNKK